MTRLVLALLCAGCAAGGIPLDGTPPRKLSQLGLVTGFADGEVQYAEGVFPYTLNAPLFSDHAAKARGLWLPDGEAATYDPEAAFTFPLGTAIVKTFLLPADLRAPGDDLTIVETRVMILQEGGWSAWPYLWDARGRDARLTPGGAVLDASFVGVDGEDVSFSYLVPQRNQCQECHELRNAEGRREITPIGPKARHLNRADDDGDNQLAHMADLGLLDGLPDLSEVPTAVDWAAVEAEGVDALDDAQVETAARDYLDINCAHCHNPRGVNGETSQLWLNHDNTDAFRMGVCKRPGSAGKGGRGREFDIVPGDAEASILHYRMVTEDVGSMMPQLGRALTHTEGAAVVGRWIDAMEGPGCEAE